MSINKIDLNNNKTKTNLKILGGSVVSGIACGAIHTVAHNVALKDVFHYSTLQAAQKKVVKFSAVGGLMVACLVAMASFFSINNKKQ